MSAINLQSSLQKLRELFEDPISGEMMTQPVVIVTYPNRTCGHRFEKIQLEGWIEECASKRALPTCPLCRAPIVRLMHDVLLRQALEILNHPGNSLIEKVEDLADDEQRVVEVFRTAAEQRREADVERGVPHRLAERRSYLQQAVAACSNFYGC